MFNHANREALLGNYDIEDSTNLGTGDTQNLDADTITKLYD